jgi:hypothetical protein
MRRDGEQDRPLWHYINFPFKTEGELESIEPKPLHPVDTLSALAENERIVRSTSRSRRLEWQEKDVAVVPNWYWHAHSNERAEPATLFSPSDDII